MCQINWRNVQELFYQKDDERNLISATFHMFRDVCIPYLTMGQFFWFGYVDKGINYYLYDCIDSTIVNIMRIIILLCFMAIIFSLMGFFLDIIGPRTLIYRMFRRYSVAGTATILFVMTIITMSYYVVVLLQDSIADKPSKSYYEVSYGFGFYLVAFAGGVEAVGLLFSLFLPYKSPHQDDDRCLIDGFDDMNHFQSPTPPPPYSLPPPPYTP
ncbi:hypothetical protein GWI33_010755 [Rhynchophorus ferrugineus]|uniref:Transmembrane protein 127 transmembrane region domain-containing protein n=1 Tax=Rhynchophorus ferrugineus TaxID=354439 RepID=A0A834IQA6_RHYFE|nr:hypothetical protein GWI33_010755 [Rhynchophorus ferrugineus]